MRKLRFAWVGITLAIFALGINFFPAFQLHYLAAVNSLFVLISLTGLRQIHRLRPEAALLLLFLCAAHFLFWYGTHLLDTEGYSPPARAFETWEGISPGASDRRAQIGRQLSKIPGQVLVFVRWPQHIFQNEWVYNDAEIDRARIVWARDLGDAEDEKLRAYYPGRSVWLLEPDARPPKLALYARASPEQKTPTPSKPEVEAKPGRSVIRLEDVPR